MDKLNPMASAKHQKSSEIVQLLLTDIVHPLKQIKDPEQDLKNWTMSFVYDTIH